MEPSLDLSFLTDKERRKILIVLERDAQMQKKEELRLERLKSKAEKTKNPVILKKIWMRSGQWFQQVQQNDKRFNRRGVDTVRSSIRLASRSHKGSKDNTLLIQSSPAAPIESRVPSVLSPVVEQSDNVENLNQSVAITSDSHNESFAPEPVLPEISKEPDESALDSSRLGNLKGTLSENNKDENELEIIDEVKMGDLNTESSRDQCSDDKVLGNEKILSDEDIKNEKVIVNDESMLASDLDQTENESIEKHISEIYEINELADSRSNQKFVQKPDEEIKISEEVNTEAKYETDEEKVAALSVIEEHQPLQSVIQIDSNSIMIKDTNNASTVELKNLIEHPEEVTSAHEEPSKEEVVEKEEEPIPELPEVKVETNDDKVDDVVDDVLRDPPITVVTTLHEPQESHSTQLPDIVEEEPASLEDLRAPTPNDVIVSSEKLSTATKNDHLSASLDYLKVDNHFQGMTQLQFTFLTLLSSATICMCLHLQKICVSWMFLLIFCHLLLVCLLVMSTNYW